MKLAKLALVFGIVLSSSACSGLNKGSAISADGVSLHLTSESLIAAIDALPAEGSSSLKGVYTSVGAMSLSSYYRYLLDKTSNDVVEVDGKLIRNSRSKLLASKASFDAAGEVYPSVRSLWAAMGFTPGRLTVQSLKAAISSSFAQGSGLNLDGSSSKSNDAGQTAVAGIAGQPGQLNLATSGTLGICDPGAITEEYCPFGKSAISQDEASACAKYETIHKTKSPLCSTYSAKPRNGRPED